MNSVHKNFKNDLKGKVFGKWKVIERDLSRSRKVHWISECECGVRKSILTQNLRFGKTTQCLDCANNSRRSEKFSVGSKFGTNTIIKRRIKDRHAELLVQCDCGNRRWTGVTQLLRTKTCRLCQRTKNVGYKKGYLTLINKKEYELWECLCECGNLVNKPIKYIRVSEFPSCGCFFKKAKILEARKHEGRRLGMATVKKFISFKKRRANYLLKCDCGQEFEQSVSYLSTVKSCGCHKKERNKK